MRCSIRESGISRYDSEPGYDSDPDMTVNRAAPFPEPASASITPPEADPGQAAPVRGSRGRHAGPAIAVQPGVVMARAVGPGRWRAALAVVRANPLASAGVAIVIAVAAFCFLGPL